jgi:hypothetical protein
MLPCLLLLNGTNPTVQINSDSSTFCFNRASKSTFYSSYPYYSDEDRQDLRSTATVKYYVGSDSNALSVIQDFMNQFVENSIELDHEFVDLVNKNFFQLL